MRNSLTAKAALLVTATVISFSTAKADDQRKKDPACDQLTKDAEFTCKVLMAAAEKSAATERESARYVCSKLCVRWTELAWAECERMRASAK